MATFDKIRLVSILSVNENLKRFACIDKFHILTSQNIKKAKILKIMLSCQKIRFNSYVKRFIFLKVRSPLRKTCENTSFC